MKENLLPWQNNVSKEEVSRLYLFEKGFILQQCCIISDCIDNANFVG